jgi:hypothetical protein
VPEGNPGGCRTPWGGNTAGNGATVTGLPLERTSVPGVYRRGSRFVVVYRSDGRQRKQAAATLVEARAIKLARDAEARAGIASILASLRHQMPEIGRDVYIDASDPSGLRERSPVRVQGRP